MICTKDSKNDLAYRLTLYGNGYIFYVSDGQGFKVIENKWNHRRMGLRETVMNIMLEHGIELKKYKIRHETFPSPKHPYYEMRCIINFYAG